MAENWKSYFCNVNDKFSSIALDLALHEQAPMRDKPWLLWVWIYLQSPGPTGLTTRDEFTTISAIDDALTKQIADRCDGVPVGRITGDNRREFYFYGADKKNFKRVVKDAFSDFPKYRYDFDAKHEPDWGHYFNVLYPSDEEMESLKNQDVLEVLTERGDTLKAIRDVHHWIYFKIAEDRAWYASQVRPLGYTIENQSEDPKKEYPYGLTITRNQSVTPDAIDDAVLELFRLAKQVNADYDGWEAQVVTVN